MRLLVADVTEVKSPSNRWVVGRWSCGKTSSRVIQRSRAVSISRWAAANSLGIMV